MTQAPNAPFLTAIAAARRRVGATSFTARTPFHRRFEGQENTGKIAAAGTLVIAQKLTEGVELMKAGGGGGHVDDRLADLDAKYQKLETAIAEIWRALKHARQYPEPEDHEHSAQAATIALLCCAMNQSGSFSRQGPLGPCFHNAKLPDVQAVCALATADDLYLRLRERNPGSAFIHALSAPVIAQIYEQCRFIDRYRPPTAE